MNQTIIKIDFKDRYKFLTATEIGAVVKHYKNYNFKTYNDIDFIMSTKKWSQEERNKYQEIIEIKNNFNFTKGLDWENTVHAILVDTFGIENVKDYTKNGFADEKTRLSATPDFLVNDKIIFEAKASSSKKESLTIYKYQVAQQCLLIPNFRIEFEGYGATIYYKDDYNEAKNEYNGFYLDTFEILEMQKEILEVIPLFWNDFENNNFNFISFQESISKLEKEEIEVEDNDIQIAYEIDIQIKQLELKRQEIVEKLQDRYKDFDFVKSNEVKMTIIKETTAKLDNKYFLKEKNKLQDKLKECEISIEKAKNGEVIEKIRKGYLKFSK